MINEKLLELEDLVVDYAERFGTDSIEFKEIMEEYKEFLLSLRNENNG